MNFITKLSNCLFICLVCFIYLLSCSREKANILDDDTFNKIMTELITIENLDVSDTTKVILINNTLKEQNVSLEKLKTTINFYKEDPGYWQLQYDQIKARLNNNPQVPPSINDK